LICEKVEAIIENCDEKLLKVLDLHFDYDVKIEIARKKDELLIKEYVLLFAGILLKITESVL
jgi:hypothetical protein